MELWKHGKLEKWNIGTMEKWTNGNMEKWNHGNTWLSVSWHSCACGALLMAAGPLQHEPSCLRLTEARTEGPGPRAQAQKLPIRPREGLAGAPDEMSAKAG